MHNTSIKTALLLLLAATFTVPAMAQDSDVAVPTKTLTIGTKIAPPFVIKADDGSLEGISIELMQRLGEQLPIKYKFKQTDLEALISGVQDGQLDASIAAITVTAAREDVIDFSHPFYTTGLAIAVPQQGNSVWLAIKRFFSWEFLTALAALVGVLLLVGFIVWLFERKQNDAEFGGTAAHGLGAGFWWAAVTMTTVGYGDKSPQTVGGRLVGLVWMFSAVIIISSFTAAIATSLTVGQLESRVKSVKDLPNVRVATVASSVSSEYLDAHGIHYITNKDLPTSLGLLATGKVDAVVYDAPLLQYLAKLEYPKRTRVLPGTFERQDYAIALPEGSTLREPLNRAMLEIINSDAWQAVLNKYLGTPG